MDLGYRVLQVNPAGFRIIDWLRDFAWVADDRLVDGWQVESVPGKIQPGETVYLLVGGRQDSTGGICGWGRVVPAPEVLPLQDRKADYFLDIPEEAKHAGLKSLAIKYAFLFSGSPVSGKALQDKAWLKIPAAAGGRHPRLYRIPDAAGKIIERLTRGEGTFGDLQFCRS